MAADFAKETDIKLYRVRFEVTLSAEAYVHAEDRESAQNQIEDMSYEQILSCLKSNKLNILNIQEVDE